MEQMSMEQKRCVRCGDIKDETDFESPGMCKECASPVSGRAVEIGQTASPFWLVDLADDFVDK